MRWVGCAVAAALVVAGCAAAEPELPSAADSPAPAVSTTAPAVGPTPAVVDPTTPPAPTPSPSPTPAQATDAELADLRVNELGRVLVAEWHIIGDTDGEYRTSRETLRAQLDHLYGRAYRPVTQSEFLDGTFPIPAGTTPLLLTFDDSTRGHLALDEDGEPTPDSAVGILEQFAAEHDDWRATAVFAFNFPEPFGDADFPRKLQWLVDNGYELSNHSVGHANLGSLSSAAVVANLADNQARLHTVVPDVPVLSLTLPFGAWPQERAVAAAGTGPDGTSYEHRLVYLVGSDPTRSPHHVDFDPMAIARVPAHAVVGTGAEWFSDWIERMDDEALRFISDGDPDVVTFPEDLAAVADVDPSLRTRTYTSIPLDS